MFNCYYGILLHPSISIRLRKIIYKCSLTDDQISLVGFDLGPLPAPWWPLLPVDIGVKVRVRNSLAVLPKSIAGLFKVKMYFSSTGQFDASAEGLEAELGGEVYKFSGRIPAGSTVDTDWLIGDEVYSPCTGLESVIAFSAYLLLQKNFDLPCI